MTDGFKSYASTLLEYLPEFEDEERQAWKGGPLLKSSILQILLKIEYVFFIFICTV